MALTFAICESSISQSGFYKAEHLHISQEVEKYLLDWYTQLDLGYWDWLNYSKTNFHLYVLREK